MLTPDEKRKRSDEEEDFITEEPATKKLLLTSIDSEQHQQQQDVSHSALEHNRIKVTTTYRRVELYPVHYDSWSKEQVYSLLIAKKENGGAGLSADQAKPLHDANLKGTSLDNIVKYIQYKDKYFAFDTIRNSFPTIAPDTLKSVVLWVDDLLKEKLFFLWTSDYAKTQLCKSIEEGGADLHIEQFGSVQIIKRQRKIDSSNEECKEKISKWLQSITLYIEELALDPLVLENARNEQITQLFNTNQTKPFIGKQELLKVALPVIENHVNSEGKLFTDKQTTPILFFAGDSGIGKSRSAIELVQCVKEKTENKLLKSFLSTKVEIYLPLGCDEISFNNGAFSCDIEIEGCINLRDNFQKMMTARLCYILDTFFLKRSFDERNWEKIRTVPKFGRFVKEILNVQQLSLVVVVDDFQVLSEFMDKSGKSGLDVVVDMMGAACSELGGDDILFLPIFSGLSITKIEDSIRRSTYPSYHLKPYQNFF